MSLGEDDTLPPLRTSESRRERMRLRRLALMALAFVALVVLGMLAGCAQLPRCPDAYAVTLEVEGKHFYLFDASGWQNTIATLRGLRDGTCRLAPVDAAPPEIEAPAGNPSQKPPAASPAHEGVPA